MKQLCIFFNVLLLVISVYSEPHISLRGFGRGTRRSSRARKITAISNRAFAHEFYNLVAVNNPNNIVISPFVVSSGFSMALLGAKGRTASQLMDALDYSPAVKTRGFRQTDVPKLYKKLCFKLVRNPSDDDGYALKIANKMFGEITEHFLPRFINDTKNYYNAKMETVNFQGDSQGAIELINEWTRDVTEGHIDNIVSPGTVTSNTRLVLASAIYFEGKWKHPFDESKTKEDFFYLGFTQKVPVQFMSGKFVVEQFYSPRLRTKKIILPYTNSNNQNKVQMELYLPEDATALADLEHVGESIYYSAFYPQRGNYENSTKTIRLPKFSIDFDLDVREVLENNMGVTDLFGSLADLSGMNGNTNLRIDSARQKAFIKVEEKGTKAAAVVVLATNRNAAGFDDVVFDRPFVFIIRETDSNTVLFMGRVSDPRP